MNINELVGKIYLGDCLDIMKQMPDKCVDLVLTDPPYGIGMDGGNIGYKGNNNFDKKDWDEFIPQKIYFYEMKRISKNQIIFGGNYFLKHLENTRCFIVWDKGEGFYNRTYAECELAWCSFNKNTKIYKYDPLANGDYKGKLHPTQKPVSLFSKIIRDYSLETDIIFDPFSGSGTTAIACNANNRQFICIEKDPEYHRLSVERLEKEQQNLFNI